MMSRKSNPTLLHHQCASSPEFANYYQFPVTTTSSSDIHWTD